MENDLIILDLDENAECIGRFTFKGYESYFIDIVPLDEPLIELKFVDNLISKI